MRDRIKKILKLGVFIISLSVIVLFVVFQSRNLIIGPSIEIIEPKTGSTVEDSLIEIKGLARNISEIKLNGRNILIDEEGNFNEKLLLLYGYNIITIEGQDRFKRKEKKILELVFK